MPEPLSTHTERIAACQQRLLGFLRVRVKDNAAAQDLAQETWAEVWEHVETYDPERGSFWTFTKIWAEFVLRRHWEEARRQPIPIGETTDLFRDAHRESADADLPAAATGDSDRPLWGTASRPTASEQWIDTAAGLLELLCRAASCTRPPHEVVAFGFNRLDWTPREIVHELAGSVLKDLTARLETEYAALAPLPTLHVAFCPLRSKMSSRLGDLVRDPRTRRVYANVLEHTIGETTLREYLPADGRPEDAIVRWWDSVKREVIKEILAAGRGPLFERAHWKMRQG